MMRRCDTFQATTMQIANFFSYLQLSEDDMQIAKKVFESRFNEIRGQELASNFRNQLDNI